MTRWLMACLVGCVFVAGCNDDNPAAPGSLPHVFSTTLSPANEVPAVTNSESGGMGSMQMQLDVTRGSNGAVTAASGTIYLSVHGFPPNTTTIGAHIHPGAAGVNGPIIVNTGITSGAPLVLNNGTGEFTVRNVTIDPALAQAIIDNPAGYYFNVHSTVNPGGYARGQLRRVQ